MVHDKDSNDMSNGDDVDEDEPPQTSSSSKKKWLPCSLLLLVVLTYIFAGALVFRALERPVAVKAADDFDAALLQFASENDCVNEHDVHELIKIVTRAIGEGGYDGSIPYASYLYMGTRNETFYSPMWALGRSFSFVYTVVSTIGFGYVAPRTPLGQFFCMLYAIMGIPLTGTIILSIGQILKDLSSYLTNFTKKLNVCLERWPRLRTFGVVFLNIILAYFLLMTTSTFFFYCTHDWTFIESYYFTTVMMTTIGFGDLQPQYPTMSNAERRCWKLLHFIYFLICYGGLSITFETFSKAQRRGATAISSCLSRYKPRCHRQPIQHEDDIELETQENMSTSEEEKKNCNSSIMTYPT